MILSNLHTHSKYCDGKSTPEELVLSAISLGFSSIGFSGHGYTPFDASFCMSESNTKDYLKELDRLKEKYKDKIEIYKGIEADLLTEYDKKDFDYTIGSVHYVTTKDGYQTVDNSDAEQRFVAKNYFGNDYLKYAENYYENVVKLSAVSPDIIGHFDLITKFNEGNKYFDENGKKYLSLALSALDEVLSFCNLFEMNTGAISRGYRHAPYPALPLLKRLKEKGARITITSDCHKVGTLDCHFKESRELLKAVGFTSAVVLYGTDFIEQAL